jgi:hypothetical protein
MVSQPAKLQECQRIQVVHQTEGAEKSVKISIERYDECLGWYTAGALTIPLHQLPLLEQALQGGVPCVECPLAARSSKIIPFPTLAPEVAAAVIAEAN